MLLRFSLKGATFYRDTTALIQSKEFISQGLQQPGSFKSCEVDVFILLVTVSSVMFFCWLFSSGQRFLDLYQADLLSSWSSATLFLSPRCIYTIHINQLDYTCLFLNRRNTVDSEFSSRFIWSVSFPDRTSWNSGTQSSCIFTISLLPDLDESLQEPLYWVNKKPRVFL